MDRLVNTASGWRQRPEIKKYAVLEKLGAAPV